MPPDDEIVETGPNPETILPPTTEELKAWREELKKQQAQLTALETKADRVPEPPQALLDQIAALSVTVEELKADLAEARKQTPPPPPPSGVVAPQAPQPPPRGRRASFL